MKYSFRTCGVKDCVYISKAGHTKGLSVVNVMDAQ